MGKEQFLGLPSPNIKMAPTDRTKILRSEMTVRRVKPTDAWEIAQVHVTSWQVAYRGSFPDDFLDNLSVENRETYWQEAIEQGRSGLPWGSVRYSTWMIFLLIFPIHFIYNSVWLLFEGSKSNPPDWALYLLPAVEFLIGLAIVLFSWFRKWLI